MKKLIDKKILQLKENHYIIFSDTSTKYSSLREYWPELEDLAYSFIIECSNCKNSCKLFIEFGVTVAEIRERKIKCPWCVCTL